jgi:hypothetical protein
MHSTADVGVYVVDDFALLLLRTLQKLSRSADIPTVIW